MENVVEDARVNFVPCMTWVRKGFAQERPVKDVLSREDLEALLKETKSEIDDEIEEEAEIEEDEDGKIETDNGDKKEDQYDFEKYDEEKANVSCMSFGGIVVSSSFRKDPNITIDGDDDDDDDDSDKSDDHIRPEDNLLLMGHVEHDAAILEVYVHNDEEGYLYVHHDVLLPCVPLCIEWLNYQPKAQGAPGNFCAIGYMSPIIEVWDLDVMNSLEPIAKLGRKPNKKKGIKGKGHKDAVLDLSWNLAFPHILASGSVDRTVLLWDLDTCIPATTIKSFKEKVQSVKWHPFESQMLLTGSCDNAARVFDCRVDNTFKEWTVDGEVERVLWDHFQPFNFFVSTSTGKVYYVDCRQKNPLWQLQSHDSAVTGLSLSANCPGMLTTASAEGTLKIWDCGAKENESQPVFIFEKNAGIGAIHCLGSCPDNPFIFSAGGDKNSNNFDIWDVMKYSAVQNRFSSRELLQVSVKLENEAPEVKSVADVKAESVNSTAGQLQKSEPMDTTGAIGAMANLSLQHTSKKVKKSAVKKKKQFLSTGVTKEESLKTVTQHLSVKKSEKKKKRKH